MGVKHKNLAEAADGAADGRVQPSWWNGDHDIGDFLEAIFATILTANGILYINSDKKGVLAPVSDFVLSALAAADGPTLAALLGCAPLDSPAFVNLPTAPTVADVDDNSVRLANTAFVQAVRALLAPKLSPQLSGVPSAPTAAGGTNTTQIATTAFVQAAVAAIVNSAPGALDTLKELADALGDDANFAATMTDALANRVRFDASQSMSSAQKDVARSNVAAIGVVRVQKFTANGTYTPDPNLIYAQIECQGGGGGGGGAAGALSQFGGGGGGSGGTYSRVTLSAASIGASQAVTVGAGGAGGVAGNNTGSSGGASSVGTLCTAPGGAPGTGSSGANGVGAGAPAAGVGDVSVRGGAGYHSGGGSVSGVNGLSGSGGHAVLGKGAFAQVTTTSSPGNPGVNYGGGGSGAAVSNSTGTAAGGAGAGGIVIVTEFCAK